MNTADFTSIITKTVDELSKSESYQNLFHQHKDGEPLPSSKILYKVIELLRSILFPGYYGNSTVNSRTLKYHIGTNVEHLFDLLSDQILAGICFEKEKIALKPLKPKKNSFYTGGKFIATLPSMRQILSTDVKSSL